MNRALVFITLTLVTGCATLAAKDDYRAYRAVRLAVDDDAEIEAMRSYLEAHPEGRWASELRASYEAREADYYAEEQGTREGLERYLERYPAGTHVEEARSRIAALAAVRTNRSEEQEVAAGVRRERREEILAIRRRWGTTAVTFWTQVLGSVRHWGEPVEQVASRDERFDDAFAAEPRPRCSSTECVKFYALAFRIPVPGRTAIQRTLRVQLRLRFEEGRRLVRAEILMPDRGFTRWYELENETFVLDQDPEQRQATIDWALERIVPTLRSVAPGAAGIDVVPEPIDPPSVRPASDGRFASRLPGQEAGEELGDAVVADAEVTAEGELILPLAVQGLQFRDVRATVFAAADEDEGHAYDGLILEWIRPEGEPGAEGVAAEADAEE